VDEYIEMVHENEGSYTLKDSDGRIFKSIKIKQEDIDKIHEDSIRKVSEAVDEHDLTKIMKVVQSILSAPVTITEYEVIAESLAHHFRALYAVIGSPNLFHHYIKQVDPEIYGKAQTLIPQLTSLAKTLNEVSINKNMNLKIELEQEIEYGL